MSDTIQGMFYFVILMAVVFAASRVMARFTGAKFSRVMAPLAPVIGGTFSTDSLTSGWLEGTYRGRNVSAVSTPGVAPHKDAGPTERYNAFDVAVLDVPGAQDWSLTFGSHSMGEIFTRGESWRFITDDPALQARLEGSAVVAEVEGFAGAGVRFHPTIIYNARQKRLTHRDNVGADTVPSPAHFQRQLELAIRLARINEQVNPAA